MTDKTKEKLKLKLQQSVRRLIENDKKYRVLKELIFVATKDVWHISTNGFCIYFDAVWLAKLGEMELDFILAHQAMHIILEHTERTQYYKGDKFHLAADITANARIIDSNDVEFYFKGIGRVYTHTFYPQVTGKSLTAEEALKNIPFDPMMLSAFKRRSYFVDSDEWWDNKTDRGENGIIVLQPNKENLHARASDFGFEKREQPPIPEILYPTIIEGDDNCETGKNETPAISWDQSSANKVRAIKERKSRENRGREDGFIERMWRNTDTSVTDWKKMVNSFVQEDVYDYSFYPADRRYADSGFFLPDFNSEEGIKNILFMVDTSGSVDEEMLSAVYGEINSAIIQFNGKLHGIIGFFDMVVYGTMPFETATELERIMPKGGGGTDFYCVFEYIKRKMANNPPSNIVVFTDGEAEYPPQSVAQNIPVLWLFTKETATAPWGNMATVKK